MGQPLRDEVLPPLLAAQIMLGLVHGRIVDNKTTWNLLADARDEISKAIEAIYQLSKDRPHDP